MDCGNVRLGIKNKCSSTSRPDSWTADNGAHHAGP